MGRRLPQECEESAGAQTLGKLSQALRLEFEVVCARRRMLLGSWLALCGGAYACVSPNTIKIAAQGWLAMT